MKIKLTRKQAVVLYRKICLNYNRRMFDYTATSVDPLCHEFSNRWLTGGSAFVHNINTSSIRHEERAYNWSAKLGEDVIIRECE